MYKKKTPIYGIPYLSSGEKIQSIEEEKRAKMLENLLFAGINGVPKVLFEDGDYDCFSNGNNTYTLIITAEHDYSLLGIVNYRLIKVQKPVVFEGLTKGNFYFIYAAYQTELDTDATKIRKLASTLPKTGKSHVLLATVDLRGDEPIIDENPDGKEYTKDFLSHFTDRTNPHGRDLHQDRLTIHDELKINENVVFEEIPLDGFFNGTDGSVFMTEKEPVFVTVMPLSDQYGQFWCKLSKDKVVVYNSGQKGGSFKLMVKVRQ